MITNDDLGVGIETVAPLWTKHFILYYVETPAPYRSAFYVRDR